MRPTIACLALTTAALSAGCGGPLEQEISAKNPAALASWRAQVATGSNAEQRRRVEEGLQEIRAFVAAERELRRVLGQPYASGAEAVDAAVAERVNGRRVGEMLQLAGEMRVRRLATELAGLEEAMAKNAHLVTRPGDLESRHHLQGLRERQKVRVDKYRDDLVAAERELAPLLAAAGGRRLLSSEDLPLAGLPKNAPMTTKK